MLTKGENVECKVKRKNGTSVATKPRPKLELEHQILLGIIVGSVVATFLIGIAFNKRENIKEKIWRRKSEDDSISIIVAEPGVSTGGKSCM